MLELYRQLGKKFTGKIAIKVHSGETGNQNFLRPQFWKPLIDAVAEDPGQAHLLERIESRNGVHTIEAAAALGFGVREYELIELEN